MKLYDVVALARDFTLTVDLPKGFRGTLVEELPAGVLVNDARAFVVEFGDGSGRGFTLELSDAEIEPLPDVAVRADAFDAHEVLDRVHLVGATFEKFVREHPYTQSQPELRALSEKIGTLLGELYQLLGQSV